MLLVFVVVGWLIEDWLLFVVVLLFIVIAAVVAKGKNSFC